LSVTIPPNIVLVMLQWFNIWYQANHCVPPLPLLMTRAYVERPGCPSMLKNTTPLHARPCIICTFIFWYTEKYENILRSIKNSISRFEAFKRLESPWVLKIAFWNAVHLCLCVCKNLCTYMRLANTWTFAQFYSYSMFRSSLFTGHCPVNMKIHIQN
jgi:hypothetical protein